MTDNAAVLNGYTKELMLDSNQCDLHVLVKPGTDLDSVFTAWDCDEQEYVRVNGWLFTSEEITADSNS